MKVVGKFKLANNVYVILLKNNVYKIGRLSNNLVYYNFSLEEKKLITLVIEALMPADKKTALPEITLNKNKYNVCVSNNIYEFNPIPNINDLKLLNNIFNNQSSYLYIKNKSFDNNFIKRFVKLGKKTLVVILSSSILLSSASCLKSDIEQQFLDDEIVIEKIDQNKLIKIIDEAKINLDKVDTLENDLIPTEIVLDAQQAIDNNKVFDDLYNYDSFNFEYIKDSLNKNPNLSLDEKNLILSSSFIFEDNFGYYNYNTLLNLLSTLKINYHEESLPGIGGTYDWTINEIDLYTAKDINSANRVTFTHELAHLIQNTYNNKEYYYNKFLTEGTNSLANSEYYDNDIYKESAYFYERNIIQALSLIIGEEPFKEYYTYEDEKKIVMKLCEVYPDFERACTLVDLLNFYTSVTVGVDDLDDEAVLDIKKQITENIKFYYEEKYKKSFDNDLLMLYLVDNNSFNEKIKILYNIDDLTQFYIIDKVSPSIISTKNRDINYILELNKSSISGYIEESYQELVEYGMFDEYGNCLLEGAIVDKENNTVLRPKYDYEEKILIEINDSNRYLNESLSR